MAQPPPKRARVGDGDLPAGWLDPSSPTPAAPNPPWTQPPSNTQPMPPLSNDLFGPPPMGLSSNPPPPAPSPSSSTTEGDFPAPPWKTGPLPSAPSLEPQQQHNYYPPPPPTWPPAPPPPSNDPPPPAPPQEPEPSFAPAPPPPMEPEPEPQPQPVVVPLSLQYEDVTDEELGIIPSATTDKRGTELTPVIKSAVSKPLRLKKDKEKHLKTEQERLARNKSKVGIRRAAEKTWVDPTMADWPDNDFRMFVGDLGNEVTDDQLRRAFSKYPSMVKVKVLRDSTTGRTRGFGFVSFLDPMDFAKAMKEMNGKYIGNRPCKLSRSTWKNREIAAVLDKEKKKKKNKVKF